MSFMEQEKRIELMFEKTRSGLAGNPYGKKIYDQQARGKVTVGMDVTFVFPNTIIRVASSFVQGFFHEWLEKVGEEGIKAHVNIECSNDELKQSIYDNLI